ncbi:MAG TPA: polyhydroxyalkanoic acid system family protein [Candidatus Paceibacterota bacterium]|nr:polyhydroxyalkanoic acid system family protein [Candidatus Paceibacterota bacterium]
MHIVIPHKTTQSKAVEKVKDGIEQGRSKIAGQAKITEERWEGNTLHFGVELQGKPISGKLEVTDADYVLDAKLPLMWRIFEGRIESEIASQVKKLM